MNEMGPAFGIVESWGNPLHGKVSGATVTAATGHVYDAPGFPTPATPHAMYVQFEGIGTPQNPPDIDPLLGRSLLPDAILPNGRYLGTALALGYAASLYKCADGTVYKLRFSITYTARVGATPASLLLRVFARELWAAETAATSAEAQIGSATYAFDAGFYVVQNSVLVSRAVSIEVASSPNGKRAAVSLWATDEAAEHNQAIKEFRECGWRKIEQIGTANFLPYAAVNGVILMGVVEAVFSGGNSSTRPSVTLTDQAQTDAENAGSYSYEQSTDFPPVTLTTGPGIGDYAIAWTPTVVVTPRTATETRRFLMAGYSSANELKIIRYSVVITAGTVFRVVGSIPDSAGTVANDEVVSLGSITSRSRPETRAVKLYVNGVLAQTLTPKADAYEDDANPYVLSVGRTGLVNPPALSWHRTSDPANKSWYVDGVASADLYFGDVNCYRIGSNAAAVGVFFDKDEGPPANDTPVSRHTSVFKFIDDAGTVVAADPAVDFYWPATNFTPYTPAGGFLILAPSISPALGMWGIFNKRTGELATGFGESWV